MKKCIDCKKEISGIKRCRKCHVKFLNSGPSSKSQFKDGHEGLIGNKNPSWKGGKRLNDAGYVMIKSVVGRGKYKREHHIIIEKHIGRKLKKSEVIHHVDKDKLNNKISNLILFRSNSAHMRFEAFLKKHNLSNLFFKQVWLYD